jgi:hypothetical protein
VTTDWQDYQPHPHQALAIYSQRVPLARNVANILGAQNVNIPASSDVQILSFTTIDQPAFQLDVQVQLPLNALGVPFIRIDNSWVFGASGDFVAARSYALAAGNNQLNVGRLIGKCWGDVLTIAVFNLHATQPVTMNWDFSTVSHIPDHDDWGNDLIVPVSGFNVPGGAPNLGILAATNPTIVPATPQSRLTNASNALCNICVDNSGQANALDVQITDPAPTIPLYGLNAGATFWRSGSVVAGGVANGQFQMPNGPVLITMTNLGGAGNITPRVTLTEQRAA